MAEMTQEKLTKASEEVRALLIARFGQDGATEEELVAAILAVGNDVMAQAIVSSRSDKRKLIVASQVMLQENVKRRT